MAETVVASCPACGYPVAANFEGETAVCANCGEKMEATISQGVTIPTPVFIGVLAFAAGILIGPALLASTQTGQAWLMRQAKGG